MTSKVNALSALQPPALRAGASVSRRSLAGVFQGGSNPRSGMSWRPMVLAEWTLILGILDKESYLWSRESSSNRVKEWH